MFQPAGLYGHIRNNNIKSLLFLIGLPIVIELLMVLWDVPLRIGGDAMFANIADKIGVQDRHDVGWLEAVGRAFSERYARGIWLLPVNMAVSLGGTYLLSDMIIRLKTGAKAVERRDEPRLYNIVENLAITAGIRMPAIEIMEAKAMNAYACGLGPNGSTIAVTRGLLKGLDDDELAGVVAHELSHIKNHDTRLMTIATTLAGSVVGIWRIIWRFVIFPTPMKIFVLLTMLPIATGVLTVLLLIGLAAALSGLMLRMALSRTREFMADAGAVELTKDPEALISAIHKTQGHDGLNLHDAGLQAMMFSGRSGGWLDANPGVEARIDALIKYAGANIANIKACARPAGTGLSPLHSPGFERRVHFGQRVRRPSARALQV